MEVELVIAIRDMVKLVGTAAVAATLAAVIDPALAYLAFLCIGILCATGLLLTYRQGRRPGAAPKHAPVSTGVALLVVLAMYGLMFASEPGDWRRHTVVAIVFLYAIAMNSFVQVTRARMAQADVDDQRAHEQVPKLDRL